MTKRGIGAISLIFIGLLIGVIVIFGLSKLNIGTPTPQEITTPQDTLTQPEADVTEETMPAECVGYADQESCESNEFNITDVCVWNSNTSSCEIQVEETIEGILDIAVVDLTFENIACISGSNGTCVLDILGALRNTGTITIDKKFNVHLFDTTQGFNLLESYAVNETLVPNTDKTFTYHYDANLTKGSYFFTFRIDGTNTLVEANENNNELSKLVKLE